ncbi:hypothetical protein HJ526_19135 [Donghicola sp. C2-DW-16]|uniref:Uncharacterized protein n=1 Tax=Donghicola mangrovi TaxID=2729614 RepID=A0ABX2PM12_9RHOB|nr:hypothetical protein [Donghicola mangrovi]NVO29539.1 hypothetical protein [Donghicola mangrovi]
MFRFLVPQMLALLVSIAGQVHAAPFEKTMPSGMADSHAKIAHQARKAEIVGLWTRGDADIVQTRWNKNYRYNWLGNVGRVALQTGVSGRYMIGQSSKNKKTEWAITYFGDSGKAIMCTGKMREELQTWRINTAPVGGYGLIIKKPGEGLSQNSNGFAFPYIVDDKTGKIYQQRGATRTFKTYWHGWIQDEIPLFAANNCPNMPRSSKVNKKQTGGTFAEMAASAKPVKIPVMFNNPIENPLTAQMYIWAYPYEQ